MTGNGKHTVPPIIYGDLGRGWFIIVLPTLTYYMSLIMNEKLIIATVFGIPSMMVGGPGAPYIPCFHSDGGMGKSSNSSKPVWNVLF